MYQIDFNKPEHVHFIGIGGISMSGLAEILMDEGFTVSGSDAHKSELTEHLEAKGAKIFYGQKAENIIDGIHVVVYTAAVHPDNPEFAAAVEKGLPILTRAELLGQMMKNYQYAVGISGTHGKTTTTSMVTGGRRRPDDFRRRYLKFHWRKHPGRRFGAFRDRSLRVYQQLFILLPEPGSDLEY